MGLRDFFSNARMPVPGVDLFSLKSAEGFDKAWLNDPCFKDFLACAGQLTKTDMDVARIGSNGYMKRISYGRVTIKDKRMKALFTALEVDSSRLREDGYICDIINKLIKAAKEADKKATPDVAENATQTVYIVSLVLGRLILEDYPEYAERIALIADALKECVR